MITLHLPVQIEDQTWEDLIVGSGFDTFSWWLSTRYDQRTKILSGSVEDPAAEDAGFIGFEVTLQEIADAASSLAKRENRLAAGLVEQDLDASDVDSIMQTCVLGDVIYG